jgi:TIR domain
MSKHESGHARWDAFISHASEDKEGFVRPLATALAGLGADVWYDEFALRLGDSLSQSIDRGLAQSRYGVVVLSPAFMGKPWPQHELSGLVARQMDGYSRIIPIWHDVTRAQVSDFSPTLADKIAVRTSDASASDIALQVLEIIRPEIYLARPRAQLLKMANSEALAELEEELAHARAQLAEFQCPFCQATIVSSIDAPVDAEEKHWDVVRTFECGYSDFAGDVRQLCPSDPRCPSFEDFELLFDDSANRSGFSVICSALGKTDQARRVRMGSTIGVSREAATAAMREQYESRVKPWLRLGMDPP